MSVALSKAIAKVSGLMAAPLPGLVNSPLPGSAAHVDLGHGREWLIGAEHAGHPSDRLYTGGAATYLDRRGTSGRIRPSGLLKNLNKSSARFASQSKRESFMDTKVLLL